MLLTIVLSLVMIASLFLMLYAAVALVQDKRLFTSAPKDIQAAIQPKEERFPGAHKLGWRLLMLSVLLFVGAIVYVAYPPVVRLPGHRILQTQNLPAPPNQLRESTMTFCQKPSKRHISAPGSLFCQLAE